MTSSYVPILLFLLVGIAFPIGALVLARFIRPNRPEEVKLSPYECGIEPEKPAWSRQSVRFYIVAVLFVVFDVETVFLFPWAVKYEVLGLFGLIEMAIFLLILVVAYVYAWRKGALQWV
jgi:NADH-quinone oxidoreductase subunit A